MMKLVLFTHPSFMPSESMKRFAIQIGEAMTQRGHAVQYWTATPRVQAWLARTRWAKWAGYVDQFLIFPWAVRWRLWTNTDPDTLFVFCDQALGPWVPLVRHRPHVVHAHDLLALRSALGLIPENPTSFTGRVYQRFIRRGFRQARHFISVSGRTQQDLQRHGHVKAETLEVVPNGLNHPYHRVPSAQALTILRQAGLPAQPRGMVLHVGGSAWYKNTAGVIRIYAEYARLHPSPLPLWMVSPPPNRPDVVAALAQVPAQGQVHFFQGLDNPVLEAAYSLAKAFLFPSLAEGFGWPLVEAQACGCPVITTDDAPMNEVAGPHAFYLPLLTEGQEVRNWARHGAEVLASILKLESGEQAEFLRAQRMKWAARFSMARAMDGYEAVYLSIATRSASQPVAARP